jgi:hypothetical protein
MTIWRGRGAAVIRQARTIGLWRLAVGLTGVAMSYGTIGASLSGHLSGWLAPLSSMLAWLLPMGTWAFMAKGTETSVYSDKGSSAAFVHFFIAVFVLFFMWGSTWFAVVRPQSPSDFTDLFPAVFGLVFSTLVLAAPAYPSEDRNSSGDTRTPPERA